MFNSPKAPPNTTSFFSTAMMDFLSILPCWHCATPYLEINSRQSSFIYSTLSTPKVDRTMKIYILTSIIFKEKRIKFFCVCTPRHSEYGGEGWNRTNNQLLSRQFALPKYLYSTQLKLLIKKPG